MKNICVALFLFVPFYLIAQKGNYVDSVEVSIKNIPKSQQLERILKIPYDKYVGQISISEKLTTSAISIALELNDSLSLAKAYSQLSTIYAYKDNREKKIEYSLKSIYLFEAINEFKLAGKEYGNLGFMLKYEDIDISLFYMRKSIKLLQNSSSKNIDPIYDNYGILQSIIQNNDSAIYYHKKSLNIKKKNQDSIGIPYGYAHIATVHILQKNFDIAKKYIDSSYVIRSKRNDVYGIGDVYAYYGDLYFEQEKYTDAITYFNKGLKLSNQNSFYNLEKYCAEKLTKSYIKLNNYKKAFEYNTVFQSLKDSTLNARTNAKVESLKIEFETEKKEKEILTQRAELAEQKLTIKTKDFITIILGASILVLGLISFGTYLYQSNKRKQLRTQLLLKDELAKTKTQNKLQDQRLRISRDLHDNIGSQLTFIISSIDNLKFLTKSSDQKLKSKLTNINSFAANTISQLRDTIWAMNKNEIPYDDFHARVLALIEKAKIAKDSTEFSLNSKVQTKIIFSSVTGITIFRVLQEAINNAIKYSEASRVKIEIVEKNDQLKIKITDNGNGFDINTIKMGNGLENMQRRMDEIDGKINIKSKLAEGTFITLTIKNT